jgi:hypothetical protein
MLRSVCALCVALPAVAACARAPAPPPIAANARGPEPPSLAISYRVTRTGDGSGVLMSGHADMDAHHAIRVHAVAPRAGGEQDLDLESRATDDGALVICVEYEEHGQDGAAIKWQPEVRVARGVPVHAEVGGNGWGRTLDLTVE